MQACGDWRKSLNWRTLAKFPATVTTVLLSAQHRTTEHALAQRANAGSVLADGRRNPRDWAHRRDSGVSSRQAPPFAGTPGVGGWQSLHGTLAPTGHARPIHSFDSRGGSTLETFNRHAAWGGCLSRTAWRWGDLFRGSRRLWQSYERFTGKARLWIDRLKITRRSGHAGRAIGCRLSARRGRRKRARSDCGGALDQAARD
jgi:hypothetical protein